MRAAACIIPSVIREALSSVFGISPLAVYNDCANEITATGPHHSNMSGGLDADRNAFHFERRSGGHSLKINATHSNGIDSFLESVKGTQFIIENFLFSALWRRPSFFQDQRDIAQECPCPALGWPKIFRSKGEGHDILTTYLDVHISCFEASFLVGRRLPPCSRPVPRL
jgi:hypothetical protein